MFLHDGPRFCGFSRGPLGDVSGVFCRVKGGQGQAHRQGNEPEQTKTQREHGHGVTSNEGRGCAHVRDDGGSERLSLVQALEESWIISGITRNETRRDGRVAFLFGLFFGWSFGILNGYLVGDLGVGQDVRKLLWEMNLRFATHVFDDESERTLQSITKSYGGFR